ncbi:hypothetical protein L1S34_05920 [Flavobacterium sp. K77]|uniref:hypothetical protein n=1 Tax=Flavobacterium sp. K77 TaxID=2910676 RepID=UPI001F21AF52|nr:hypothetical protein [Flavobacterium sp. K77]MCF6140817.1 hypothetical protein [Flavobacterium sp. K77]
MISELFEIIGLLSSSNTHEIKQSRTEKVMLSISYFTLLIAGIFVIPFYKTAVQLGITTVEICWFIIASVVLTAVSLLLFKTKNWLYNIRFSTFVMLLAALLLLFFFVLILAYNHLV